MKRWKWLLGTWGIISLLTGCVSFGRSSGPNLACLIPPAFDPGVGEFYFCDRPEGVQHLIAYARRSFNTAGEREDIWVHFQGVFDHKVWINIGEREANDTSFPVLDLLPELIRQMQRIKAEDRDALQAFLAPLERTPARNAEEQAFKETLLNAIRASAVRPADHEIQITLYHVHLKPTREIEERSLMPINHLLSLPSHTDLFYAHRIDAMVAGLGVKAEHRIAVPAGIWTYRWEETTAIRFVQTHYDGPSDVPEPLKYAHAYTKFAITKYHEFGLNDPSKITPAQVRSYIELLRQTGADLSFTFAADWEEFRTHHLLKP